MTLGVRMGWGQGDGDVKGVNVDSLMWDWDRVENCLCKKVFYHHWS